MIKYTSDRSEFIQQMQQMDQQIIQKQCHNSYDCFKSTVPVLTLNQHTQLQPTRVNQSQLVQLTYQQKQISYNSNLSTRAIASSFYRGSAHSLDSVQQSSIYTQSSTQQPYQKNVKFESQYNQLLRIQIPQKEPQLKSILKNQPALKPQQLVRNTISQFNDGSSETSQNQLLPQKPYMVFEKPRTIDDYLKQLNYKIKEEGEAQSQNVSRVIQNKKPSSVKKKKN